MFNNVGKKIKGVASFFAWCGIIVSVIIGILMIRGSESKHTIILGVVVLAVGSIVSWLSSLLLYGFGELVDSAAKLAKNTEEECFFVPDESDYEKEKLEEKEDDHQKSCDLERERLIKILRAGMGYNRMSDVLYMWDRLDLEKTPTTMAVRSLLVQAMCQENPLESDRKYVVEKIDAIIAMIESEEI